MESSLSWLLPVGVVAGCVLGLIILIALLARNYIKVPPNKVAVFYGRKRGDKGYTVITGGAKFKWPIIENVQFMDMAVFQLKLQLAGIPNKDGVKLSLNAVATCKIKSDQVSLGAAVERFLGKQPGEIHTTVQENLEGQLRSVVGTMTIEQLIQDREALNNRVKSEATGELDKIGVQIDILNIQQITDEMGYIEALGVKRTSVVKSDAAIGKANAERDATQQSTTAIKDGQVTAAQNDAMTAEAAKERDVKKATYAAQIAAEQARAAQAGPLAKAQAEQGVIVQQVAVEEANQKAQIAVQARKAEVAAQRELAEKVIPAQRTAEATVAVAEGAKKSQIITSEGARDAAINAAEAARRTLELEGEGEAAKIRAIGLAKAAAIQAQLEAEAAGLLKKANAYRAMDQAATTQMILEKLPGILDKVPEIVAAAARPLSAIDKVVVIDQGGAQGGQSGIQRFIGQVPATLLNLLQTADQMGFDLKGMLSKIGIKATDIAGIDAAPETKPAALPAPAPEPTPAPALPKAPTPEGE